MVIVDLSRTLHTSHEPARGAGQAGLRGGGIAVAAVHGIDYPLTWNFRHIDNAEIKPVIRRICIMYGYASPEICTLQELMGDFKDA